MTIGLCVVGALFVSLLVNQSEGFVMQRHSWQIFPHPVFSSRRVVCSPWALTGLSLALILAMPTAGAVVLGQMQVQSFLGQPLRVEIDVNEISAAEAANLSAKLASAEAYQRAGVMYSAAAGALQFQLGQRPDGSYALLGVSPQPAAEPYVDIVLELSWASGKLSRIYTALLDPVGSGPLPKVSVLTPIVAPQLMTETSVQPSASVQLPPAQESTHGVADVVPPVTAAQPTAAITQQKASDAATTAASAMAANRTLYIVRRGDTLSGIASEYAQQRDSVHLEQMLLALYRNNAQAFIDGNIHRLKSGVVLRVPSAEQAGRVSRQEARQLLVQTAGFDRYRERLANLAASQTTNVSPPSRTAAGHLTTQVEEPAMVPVRDQLKLSKAGEANEKQVREEAQIASQRALQDAQERVAQLEKTVGDLQKLLALKNMAAASAATATVAVATNAAPQNSVLQASSASTSRPVMPQTVEKPASAAAPTKLSPVGTQGSGPGAWWQQASIWMGGGLIALLLLTYFLYRKWLWRSAQQRLFQDSVLSQQNTLMGDVLPTALGVGGGQHIDTNQGGDFSAETGRYQPMDMGSDVDPIAEADVYIAYGRDEQAEEILREALHQQPERLDLRLKLLEIYRHRQDVSAFETVASELYQLTQGEGPDWEQAASMGRELDSTNLLYQSAMSGVPASLAVTSTENLIFPMQQETQTDISGLTMDEMPPQASVPPSAQQIFSTLDLSLEEGGERHWLPPAAASMPEGIGAADTAYVGAGADLPALMSLAPAAPAPELHLDLSAISLDLPMHSDTMPVELASQAVGEAVQDLGTGSYGIQPSAHHADYQTRLALADTYLKMGEVEQARSLLQEVLNQGDANQREEAQQRLATLTHGWQ